MSLNGYELSESEIDYRNDICRQSQETRISCQIHINEYLQDNFLKEFPGEDERICDKCKNKLLRKRYINMEYYLGYFEKGNNTRNGLIIRSPDMIDCKYPEFYMYSNNKLISYFSLKRFDSRSARTIELEKIEYLKKIDGVSYDFMWFNNLYGDVDNTARVESVSSLKIENFWNNPDLSPFLNNISTAIKKDHISYCKEYDNEYKQFKIKCKRHDIIEVPDDGTAESLKLPLADEIPKNIQQIWDKFIKGNYLTREYKTIIRNWFSEANVTIKI